MRMSEPEVFHPLAHSPNIHKVKCEPDQSWKPRTPFVSPTWGKRTQVFQPYFTLFTAHYQGVRL